MDQPTLDKLKGLQDKRDRLKQELDYDIQPALSALTLLCDHQTPDGRNALYESVVGICCSNCRTTWKKELA